MQKNFIIKKLKYRSEVEINKYPYYADTLS